MPLPAVLFFRQLQRVLAVIGTKGGGDCGDSGGGNEAPQAACDHGGDRAKPVGNQAGFELPSCGPPMKNTMFTPIIRPRRRSGVSSCRIRLRKVMLTVSAAPVA